MTKSVIYISLTIIFISVFLISCKPDGESPIQNISVQTNARTNNSESNVVQNAEPNQTAATSGNTNQANDKTTSQNGAKTISKAEIREGEQPRVYVTFSNGETKMIAETVPFKQNNFTEVRTFRRLFVSPNKQFLAIDANGFEESFVQIYDAAADALHRRTYGQVEAWTDGNLLKVKSCDPAGENCSGKISVSADKPWEFRQQDDGIVVDGARLLPTDDFISSIKKVKRLSTFARLIESAVAADAIKGTGPFTVFAPTNDAFDKLPKGTVPKLLRPENKKMLVELINRHVVAGEYNTARFENKTTLKTINTETLTVNSENGGQIKINGNSIITMPNIYASNGVIHLVSEVLSK